MKNFKILSILLFLIISLTSCSNPEEKNIENNKNVNIEGEKKINVKKEITKKTDKEIKEEIIKEAKKRIQTVEKLNKEKFNLDLKNCEGKKNSNICKSIVINIAGTKTKDIKLCEILKTEKDIKKCRTKIILKLVAKENNSKYCEELGEMEKEMCLGEYEENLKREVDMVREMEKNF